MLGDNRAWVKGFSSPQGSEGVQSTMRITMAKTSTGTSGNENDSIIAHHFFTDMRFDSIDQSDLHDFKSWRMNFHEFSKSKCWDPRLGASQAFHVEEQLIQFLGFFWGIIHSSANPRVHPAICFDPLTAMPVTGEMSWLIMAQFPNSNHFEATIFWIFWRHMQQTINEPWFNLKFGITIGPAPLLVFGFWNFCCRTFQRFPRRPGIGCHRHTCPGAGMHVESWCSWERNGKWWEAQHFNTDLQLIKFATNPHDSKMIHRL